MVLLLVGVITKTMWLLLIADRCDASYDDNGDDAVAVAVDNKMRHVLPGIIVFTRGVGGCDCIIFITKRF